MKRSRIVGNESGFSLIELMVVVAIIGMLAAVAIPQVSKYMERAKQSEAKGALSGIYTSNQSFFSEFNIYDQRFTVIGYAPAGQLRYNVGWNAAGGTCALANYGYTATVGAPDVAASTFCGSGSMNANGCWLLADGQAGSLAGAATALACNSTFTAGAAGRLQSATGVIDTWSIDNTKYLKNVLDGT